MLQNTLYTFSPATDKVTFGQAQNHYSMMSINCKNTYSMRRFQ